MFTEIEGGVVAPKGFKASAVHCGVSDQAGVPDLGIIFSEYPASIAAVFTTNEIAAPPVLFSRKIAAKGRARAVVVNSGSANACTGEQGYRDAQTTAQLVAKHLSINDDEVIVASTGIIGHLLPMEKIQHGIESVASSLGSEPSDGENISRAILTTDTVPKSIAVKTRIKGFDITVGGISKGSGMISPKMTPPLTLPLDGGGKGGGGEATMLGFLTTDAPVPHDVLTKCLCQSVERSFNRITVDGHMSTNDMVMILANGAACNGNALMDENDLEVFQLALNHVTLYLAKAIVRDGEGATKFVEIEVNGARSEADAEQIARSIANSPLVKTAINGEDPNWGRIVSAAGYAGIPFDDKRVKLYIGDQLLFENGLPTTPPKEKLKEEMKKKDINIRFELGLGSSKATIWTCDLSHGYITINAEYHT